MIARMARLRLLGPRRRLPEALGALQDLGVVHVAPPSAEGCSPIAPQTDAEAALASVLVDLDALSARTGPAPGRAPDPSQWAARAAEARAALEALDREIRALGDERARIERVRSIVAGFGGLAHPTATTGLATFFLVLPGRDAERSVADLRAALGDTVQVITRPLAGRDLAVALVTTRDGAARVEQLLARAALEDLSAPAEYGGGSLTDALPAMLARAEAIDAEVGRLGAERTALEQGCAGWVTAAAAAAHDELARLEAARTSAETSSAFVVEGWVPARDLARVTEHLRGALGPELVAETVEVCDWTDPVPVELQNPPIFRPFEVITRSLPLPAYGSLDPTPFVAVGFPMLFGMILGDIGYGALLLAGAAVLAVRRKTASIGAIGLACGLFSVVFGALYGELFGDLGRTHLGLHPLALDREEAILPSLVLAIGVGLAHVLLGLVLGVVSAARREPRKAIGRGLAAVTITLLVLALLAVAGVLPRAVFQPVLVAALVAFPLLVWVEGVVGPIELLGTFANILSYARIMAVGTASVMMAVVANRMVGAFGSALVGVLFAVVFHVVNFALGVFAPTIHVLRLHYVEFFGKFHHPDGTVYRPLRRWDPAHTA